jgi:low affinity Fe/Cu permease
MTFETIACRVAVWFASPSALIGVIVASGAWLAFGLPMDALTFVLSVLAITTTQLVLAAQQRTERQMKHAEAEVIRAVPGELDGQIGEMRG